MPNQISLDFLVNPGTAITAPVALLRALEVLPTNTPILAPPSVQENLRAAIASLDPPSSAAIPASLPCPSNLFTPTPPTTQTTNIPINHQTSVSKLYHYPVNAIVEYPESSADGRIGHLFDMDPENWTCPSLNIVYSLGEPRGQKTKTRSGKCRGGRV
ncbi:hypothetical protein C8J57DRAFT_1517979 [Mycena rebaudengoi]|nr:hypothetical protein C8J57DRAFT_1517979 [Mycena rebaudengoi]